MTDTTVPDVDPDFESLLEFVKQSRGFDFTGYKRTSLLRLFTRRLTDTGVADFAAYSRYLQSHPEEYTNLFNTVLINVTSFFRNPPAWEALQHQLLPRLLEQKHEADPIRVWTAACASGEETCTVAMILAETLGLEAYAQRVKIYATDLDDHALQQARQASYPSAQLANVPEPLRERYFETSQGQHTLRSELRRAIIFGKHNLVSDASISRLDLLICRNALMYFNAELQSRILLRFHFGLGSPGYLFLGKAEMLLAHADLFRPFDFQHRMFEKIPRPTMRERFVVLSNNSGRHADHPRLIVDEPTLAELAIDAWPDACMIVDRQGNLAQINAQARMKFRLLPADVGRPLSDFPISTVPVELGPRIAQAIRFQSPVIVKDVSFQNESGDLEMVDVRVTPLGPARRPLGVCITYRSTHGATRPIPDDPKTSSDLSSEGGK